MKFPALAVLSLAILAGCHDDRPHSYGEERPPVDELHSGDKGLQSKDVVSATDSLAQDLLADPGLNASKTQWALVVTNVEPMNRTIKRAITRTFSRNG